MLFTDKYVTSYLVFVAKYVCMCKPSLLYYYARLSRNTLDLRVKTKVKREEEEEEEDHPPSRCFNYIFLSLSSIHLVNFENHILIDTYVLADIRL